MDPPSRFDDQRLSDLLEQIEFLGAMFPLEDEFVIDREAVSNLHQKLQSPGSDSQSQEGSITFKIRVPLQQSSSPSSSTDQDFVESVYLCCSIGVEDGIIKFWVDRHPSIPRSITDSISTEIENYNDLQAKRTELVQLTETTSELIELIQKSFPNLTNDFSTSNPRISSDDKINSRLRGEDKVDCRQVGEDDQRCTRVWMRLPSLSSKEKREDMVKFAKDYNITGFVLAGKPALVCLESSRSETLDRYMSEIKTISWSDIPSFQKKVTEILRESDVDRIFGHGNGNDDDDDDDDDFRGGMIEITDDLKKKGFRNFRTDFGEIVNWLKDHGVKPSTIESVLGISLL